MSHASNCQRRRRFVILKSLILNCCVAVLAWQVYQSVSRDEVLVHRNNGGIIDYRRTSAFRTKAVHSAFQYIYCLRQPQHRKLRHPANCRASHLSVASRENMLKYVVRDWQLRLSAATPVYLQAQSFNTMKTYTNLLEDPSALFDATTPEITGSDRCGIPKCSPDQALVHIHARRMSASLHASWRRASTQPSQVTSRVKRTAEQYDQVIVV
jgi:hypothetical protein